jgi:hypothetical protein
MNDRNVFDFNPQMSRASQQVFTRYRVLSIAGLLIAMIAAALMAG